MLHGAAPKCTRSHKALYCIDLWSFLVAHSPAYARIKIGEKVSPKVSPEEPAGSISREWGNPLIAKFQFRARVAEIGHKAPCLETMTLICRIVPQQGPSMKIFRSAQLISGLRF